MTPATVFARVFLFSEIIALSSSSFFFFLSSIFLLCLRHEERESTGGTREYFEVKKEADFIVIDLNATELISQKMKTALSISDILFNLMTLGDDRLIDEVYILGQRTYKK